jgi:putative oxidoreductase
MAIATAHRHSSLRDLGLLLARVVLGVVFAAHGWQKLNEWGLSATAQNFAGMGAPLPDISSVVVTFAELIGGILLILGAFTPWIGIILAIDMLVAAILVHIPNGLFIDGGGWENVGGLGAGALALAATGAGRFSIDHLTVGRRSERKASGSRATGSHAASADA